METSPLICRAIQWTDSYMIGTSLMKTLITVTSEKQIFQNLLIKNTVSLRKQKQVFDMATNQTILGKISYYVYR